MSCLGRGSLSTRTKKRSTDRRRPTNRLRSASAATSPGASHHPLRPVGTGQPWCLFITRNIPQKFTSFHWLTCTVFKNNNKESVIQLKRRFGTQEVYLSKFGKSGCILLARRGERRPDYRLPVVRFLEPPLGRAEQLYKILVPMQ